MKAARYLWLIRHAPVAGPAGVIHAPDAPADVGDASRIAALRAVLPTTASHWCSPSRRTVETAAALDLDASVLQDLREQDFGGWTGRRHADLAAEPGAAYGDFWLRPDANRPPGGESFADQMIRVADALDRLPSGDTILVVHSGTVRSVLALALGMQPRLALQFVIDPLSLTRIDQLDGEWRIVAVNQRASDRSG